MPSRKQRRRREKGRRHEYEYVYVDEEGREVEVDEAEPEAERAPKAERAKARSSPSGRAVRPVPPPSWGRVGRRLLIFAPLMFILFSLTSEGVPVIARLAYTLGYAALFAPFLYYIDRWAYRRYLRQTGRDPDAAAPARANGRRR